jgi:hypothetical protein
MESTMAALGRMSTSSCRIVWAEGKQMRSAQMPEETMTNAPGLQNMPQSALGLGFLS